MIAMTLAEVATLTGGRLVGPAEAADVLVTADVVTDSREARSGSLYVARVGEQADGHAFCAAAREGGAVAALTTRIVDDVTCVVVEDTQDAFAALARAVVDRGVAGGLAVVGVTGSSGKTSTKDLLGQVLGAAGPTVAPVGSYNGEVGVPLTVCRITEETRCLVVEMGARGVGHIDYLTRIAPPRVGVVLNVGSAHVGEFGSVAAIGRAKSELVAALPADGLAVLNADDPVVRAMAAATSARVVLVGEAADADVRASEITLDERSRPSFTVDTPAGSASVRLALSGRHHVGNALAVLAVALELGLTLDAAVASLAGAGPVSRWRMELTARPDGVTVVNDAYNANPESMRAALSAVAQMGARRRWAVLGSMLELGEAGETEHAGIGVYAVERHLDELVAVGPATRPLAEAAHAHAAATGDRTRVRWVPDTVGAEAILTEELADGDVVVFKSSRDAGLRWLGDRVAGRTEDAS